MIRQQTLCLWLVAIALGAGVWWVEKPLENQDLTMGGPATLMEPSTLGRWDGLVVAQSDQTWVFEKNWRGWNLQQPIADLAHPTRITQLLETLARVEVQSPIRKEDIQTQGGWEAFGLQEPTWTLQWKQGDQVGVLLQMGQKASAGQKVYVRINEEENLWVVDASWLDQLNPELSQWRDPRVVSLPTEPIDQLEWLHADHHVVIQRDIQKGVWRLMEPAALAGVRPNLVRLETLMEKVLPNWQALSFLPKEETQDRLLLGLEDPVCTFVLKAGEKEVDRIAFGYPDPENPALRFAYSQKRDVVMRVLENLYDQQFDLPASAFRDPFLIEPGYACNEVILKGPTGFTLAYDANTTAWRFVDPSDMPTDPTLVQTMYQNLVNLQIMAYHDELSQNQVEALFEKPSLQLTLATRQGEALIQSLDLSFSPAVGGSMLVRRSDETTLYELPASKLMDLPNHPIKLRRQSLWRVAPADLVEATIAIGGERTTLRRTSTDLWMVGEQPMDEAHAKDWSLFIAQLVEPEVREWVEADDQRYEAFGLTDADQPIKLIVRLSREGRSVDRSMVVGRQGPDATYYAGSEVETGPVVCKVSLDLVEILRQVHAWGL